MRSAGSNVVRFGVFELDTEARELRKRGVRVKLQDQPLRLLEVLLERPGQIVTREDLRQRLWADDEFVEFDKSLNTAVQKIRQALGDSAESPRFLETIPRHGYRFMAPVSRPDPPAAEPPEPVNPQPPRAGPWLLALSALGLLAIGAAMATWLAAPATESPNGALKKFTLDVVPAQIRGAVFRGAAFRGAAFRWAAPSPDGRYVAYVTGSGADYQIRIWDSQRDEHRVLVERGGDVSWSPDGTMLAAADIVNVAVIDLASGSERILASWPDQPGWLSIGASWTPDGEYVVFAAGAGQRSTRMYRVPAGTGPRELLFEPSAADIEGALGFLDPHMLPADAGLSALLFARGVTNNADIGVIDLESGERRILVSGDASYRAPVYSETGHVLYQESTGLGGQIGERIWAVPFSLETLSVTGDPFLVAESARWPALSNTGALTYLELGSRGSQQLVWRDRRGDRLGTIGAVQESIRAPALSPDHRQVAVRGVDDGIADIWVHETDRPVKRRLTFDVANEDRPTWRPSGQELTFSSSRAGRADTYITAADGTGEPRVFFASPSSDFGYEWSRDGKYLVGSGGGELWYLHQNADTGEWERVQFADDRFDHVGPDLSPDARFLAYESDETGRSEIWVRPFPEGEGKWLVSTNGGAQPRWRGDGREIFYVQGDDLMAVPVAVEPELKPGTPKKLFAGNGAFQGRGHRYDVTADGQRFVVVDQVEPADPGRIRVVLNWFEEFRNRNP